MKRGKFSLSHYKLLSMDLGELVPVGLVEVLPGDTIQHATSALVRCSPMLAPVMHPVHVRIHHWFVPHRLSWDSWEDFITGGPNGTSLPAFPVRTFSTGTTPVGGLPDYLGIPSPITTTQPVSALPFRAYAQIWNEWYRDQDLQAPVTVLKSDGNDGSTNVSLLNCGWEKDYFTSSRPWEQKGPAVTIPLGTSAPVLGVAVSNAAAYNNAATGYKDAAGGNPPAGTNWGGPGVSHIYQADDVTKIPTIRADLTAASAITVGALREALAIQRAEEARARYGSRYVEYLRYLGVRSSDARLARPEYLGGGKQTIQFSEVVQSSSTVAGSPLGELGGHGISAMRSNRYRRFFEEHGYIISLMSIKPKTIYAQGIPRTFNRRSKEDFWQLELQHIGQQEVLNKEIYAPGVTPDGIFGYQDRYDEYRRSESSIAGEFRSSTLNHWHFARIFASAPALNADFVNCIPPERPFAVPSEDVIYCMVNHSIQARRLVSPVGKSFIY